MANMAPNKIPMPEQAPDVRNKNYLEVALGYSEEQAVEEATRCINCKNKPCMNGKFAEAYEIITQTNSLPAVCGRVCPQETQCESKCVRGIKNEPVAIGRLERFAAD